MKELIDKAYEYVEKTLTENLARHQTVISKTKSFIRYDRFYHIQRVTAWSNRICDELCNENAVGTADAIDKECLHLASILHDVGYNAYHISMDHSEAGVVLAELFLTEEGVEEEKKENTSFLRNTKLVSFKKTQQTQLYAKASLSWVENDLIF